ncbi:uncharacterized protein MONOS_14234 [Monocercomonoides exilis]|uniref:uncharacterized protein n=1 Tax=Monocercomonoides exilis TaxID=2049356 RepID=UPI003559D267|nr:hypothetical protein MONOS_14234 [Monocercomonoides exilis]|eukprot:MONOS_14234.1-p1 / transcript=MONOS_14234.1 / gene=MONOS_14234 / organism=Monocercomonoides_exilis_PA203 / gene_product=unspecified product / transcript_product=unspecified product / location=Mono_scaffold00960:19594-20332(+) / protein_length=86 / sequence_SO=supercontig / SO=protein_coding / is_pseudo=false
MRLQKNGFVDSLAAPHIYRARDGGRGGRGLEEGTSALALCIGGVETEEDEGLTMGGCLAMERDRKRMEVFNFDLKKDAGRRSNRE